MPRPVNQCSLAASFPRSPRLRFAPHRLLRHSSWDLLLVILAMAHGVVLVFGPPFWVIALALWWNANTISHNFIHLPFFRSRGLNRGFSVYLSLLLGFPQSLWRDRHLAHHRECSLKWNSPRRDWLIECALVFGLWLLLLAVSPEFFLTAYLPGWGAGLALCQIQGHFEHSRGTISHYGWLYNWLFFNDGFHTEHHARPARHWRELAKHRHIEDPVCSSRWPAVLRWMEWLTLDGLERLVLRSRRLQKFVMERHEKAFRRLLPLMPKIQHATIVGGGLFPRSALILRRLAPEAGIRVVDARLDHLECARALLDPRVELRCGFYNGSSDDVPFDTDLMVFPLAFVGDKAALYHHPPGRCVLVHDWLWRKRGESVIVSVWLFKRLNLVRK